MNFNKHFKLEGKHAFLGASKYHWVNYDTEKLITTWTRSQAVARGVELHDFAKRAIDLGIKLPKTKNTLNAYINDAIGFRMSTEVVLYYSDHCFGTADTIAFRNDFLRIHDYKSGVTPAGITQLEIYAALFCLEYIKNPNEIDMELRIYQNNEILIHHPEKERILYIMGKIIESDREISRLEGDM